MTVCVGIAVNDCVVFAADSASSLVQTHPETGESQILNVYRYGDKVFNLYKGLPIVAMTCGMGNIGSHSIATLCKHFRQRLSNGEDEWRIDREEYTIEEVACKARKYLFEERYQALDPKPPAPHSFEFWIGGYGSDLNRGHDTFKIAVHNGECGDPVPQISGGNSGVFWGGQIGPLNRLLVGFDPRMKDALLEAKITEPQADVLVNHLRAKFMARLVSPTMPVGDAIDLAVFMVDVTKRFFRFLPGADIVGGETDVAVVTRFEGFKWIQRKHYYPAHLNPVETTHV